MKKSMFVVWMLILSCLSAAPLFVATASASPVLIGGVESVPVLDPLSSSAAIGNLTLTGSGFDNPLTQTGNLTVFLNAAVLSVGPPMLWSQSMVFTGLVSGNSVSFANAVFGNGVAEVQNIFVNPSLLPPGFSVEGLMSITGPNSLPVNDPTQTVAVNGTSPTAAPEPTTMLLLGLGLVGLAGVRSKFSN